jgi:hypothetical protein
MTEDDNSVPGVERLMIEKLLGIFLRTLKPQQFAYPTGAEHVVPHDAGVGQRVEANIGAVTRECLLHRQHGVARPVEMDEPPVGERLGDRGGCPIEGSGVRVSRRLRNLD